MRKLNVMLTPLVSFGFMLTPLVSLFADGTVWDTAYLQAQIPVLPVVGTEGDDTLQGMDGAGTSIQGLGGLLWCEAANDETAQAWRVAA